VYVIVRAVYDSECGLFVCDGEYTFVCVTMSVLCICVIVSVLCVCDSESLC